MKTNSSTSVTRPFGMRDKIGYMFGDFGNDFTFALSSSFMLKFYTDVMGVSAIAVGMLMMAARFIDAFTDVAMGQIVDRSKPTKDRKFRPWLKRICGPVAITSFLIFQAGFADMSYSFKLIWMVVTYILWGSIFYTAVNIPYGSMASALSGSPDDRAALSTWRTIGATLANTFIGVGVPLVAYITVDGKTVMSGSRMTIIAAVFSIFAIICYLLCFHLTTERVRIEANTEKFEIGKLLKSLFTNRSLIGVIAASIFLILAMLTMQSMANYVFPNYYGNTKAQSLAALIGSLAVLVICAPTTPKLVKKYGKREVAIASMILSSVSYGVCFVLRPESAYGYVAFYSIAYMGIGFFNSVLWAMITDVIDETELKKGIREDGTIYSVYSFARKLGQAFSAGLSGALLNLAGYTEATAFETEVTSKIFDISCMGPFIGFLLAALCLIFIYKLSKKRVDENAEKLAQKHLQTQTI